MPYTKSTPQSRHGKPHLVKRLVAELRNPTTSRSTDLPDIHEDQIAGSGRVIVRVIWDDPEWSALDRALRGGIILDAYEQAQGQDAAQKIMLAMGLTTPEASQLGMT